MEPFLELNGVRVPRFLYGTAWKEERTAANVRDALAAGFRGIDTANQRKHYFEAAVGEAVKAAALPREELFLQTKFTYAGGQDHRLPYDPAARLATQVEQSFASSLSHLGVDRLDAFLLHGPESAGGWSAGDREAWGAMEALQRAGKTRLLGVSNVSREQLQACLDAATVQPALVQNRCYARTGWDREVRALCKERGIGYEGFSLLTANGRELHAPAVAALAAKRGATVPQLVFRFCLAVGMIVLTGTTDRQHRAEDLAAIDVALDPAEVDLLERIGERSPARG